MATGNEDIRYQGIIPEVVVTPVGNYTNYTGLETNKPSIDVYQDAMTQKARVNAALHILNQYEPNVPKIPSRSFSSRAAAWLGMSDKDK